MKLQQIISTGHFDEQKAFYIHLNTWIYTPPSPPGVRHFHDVHVFLFIQIGSTESL